MTEYSIYGILSSEQKMEVLMFATLGREWELLDGKTKHFAKVAPGRYELEKIPNPFGHEASWLVLKGAMGGIT